MVLPCGVDLQRFRPFPRAQARAELGLDLSTPYLLFPADPARASKRFDRARALAGTTSLLTLGGIDPEQVPLWINAANAVIVPSEREGFGLAVLEALACDVPVLATPVGVHPEVLKDLAGTLCAPSTSPCGRPPWSLTYPRQPARSRPRAVEPFSAERMAQRVEQHGTHYRPDWGIEGPGSRPPVGCATPIRK